MMPQASKESTALVAEFRAWLDSHGLVISATNRFQPSTQERICFLYYRAKRDETASDVVRQLLTVCNNDEVNMASVESIVGKEDFRKIYHSV